MDQLDRRKDAMIAALWSNSNFDDDKGTRQEAIAEIENHYKEARKIIYGVKPPPETQEETDEELANNPFFAPAIAATRAIEVPDGIDPESVADAVGVDPSYLKGLDQ